MLLMPHFERTDCRIKIQVCIGRFPDGRARTRTFGIKNVRPDVTADDIAAVVRALAPLLAYPVVQARLVRKYVLVVAHAFAMTKSIPFVDSMHIFDNEIGVKSVSLPCAPIKSQWKSFARNGILSAEIYGGEPREWGFCQWT